MSGGRRATRRGFTLVETLIALVLSSFVLMLVSTTFLVQNRYHATQLERARAQDNVRTATEMIAREVRGAMGAGFVVAGPRTLAVRSPIATGVICSRDGSTRDDVHFGVDIDDVDTSEMVGIAVFDEVGNGRAYETGWSAIDGGTTAAAANCVANGADPGAEGSFRRLVGLQGALSPTPREGEVVVLFRVTSFTIRSSAMDPTTLGLFRARSLGTPIEFATGMDASARFQYRTAPGTYVDTVPEASIHLVDAVRLVAEARRPAVTGGADDVTFGWTVTLAPRLH